MHGDRADSPIILIGMHRSGTSILSQILGDLGLFCGHDQSRKNHESHFFVEINKWLFRQCGAVWDRPLPVRELAGAPEVFEACRGYVAKVLASKHFSAFGGSVVKGGRYLGASPWGWKDPRNTFTLPLWLTLFPRAKVVHVHRNGVDVANSLKVREVAHLRDREGSAPHQRPFTRRRLEQRDLRSLVMSLRCHSLEGALGLWGEYMEEAATQCEALQERALTIRYEELLASPVETLTTLCDFCGLEVAAGSLEAAASGLKPDRAFAYRRDPELTAFSERHRALLERW